MQLGGLLGHVGSVLPDRAVELGNMCGVREGPLGKVACIGKALILNGGALRIEGGAMKISIEERPGLEDIEVSIACGRTDRRVLELVARLRMYDCKVTGSSDGRTYIVSAEDVLYVESVDKRTFFYTEDGVYETPLRLYEMEERLEGCEFMRASKGCVLNFRKIASLRPALNGRIVATLDNGEQVVISRQYAPDVRRRLGLGSGYGERGPR